MAKKILQSYDFAGNQIIAARIENLASFPAAGSAGRLVLNTTTSLIGFDNGSAFRALAPLDSPAFTGNPTVPTQTAGDNSTKAASTAYVDAAVAAGSVPDNGVTNAKLADMVTARIKGRATAGTGDPEDLTAAQVKTMLAIGISDVASLQTTLDGKAATSHTHTATDITDFATAVNTQIVAYWDSIAGTDANVDTIREVLDLILSHSSDIANQIARHNATIGDGTATSIAVTHGLNSNDVTVEVYDIGTGETVSVGVTRTNVNTVTIEAFPAPATNSLRVVIKK